MDNIFQLIKEKFPEIEEDYKKLTLKDIASKSILICREGEYKKIKEFTNEENQDKIKINILIQKEEIYLLAISGEQKDIEDFLHQLSIKFSVKNYPSEEDVLNNLIEKQESVYEYLKKPDYELSNKDIFREEKAYIKEQQKYARKYAERRYRRK